MGNQAFAFFEKLKTENLPTEPVSISQACSDAAEVEHTTDCCDCGDCSCDCGKW